MEIILSCAQVAAWLHCSETTIRKMAVLGQIPCIKCGKRLLFIVSDLEDWFFRKMEIIIPENPGDEPGQDENYRAARSTDSSCCVSCVRKVQP